MFCSLQLRYNNFFVVKGIWPNEFDWLCDKSSSRNKICHGFPSLAICRPRETGYVTRSLLNLQKNALFESFSILLQHIFCLVSNKFCWLPITKDWSAGIALWIDNVPEFGWVNQLIGHKAFFIGSLWYSSLLCFIYITDQAPFDYQSKPNKFFFNVEVNIFTYVC